MSRPRRNPRDTDFDTSQLPSDVRADMEARMREREEIMRARYGRDRESLLKERGRLGPRGSVGTGMDVDGEDTEHDEILRHHIHRHSKDELHRVHKDISERHKELIDHRQKVSLSISLTFSFFVS
jgi:hypothetical protein